MTLVTHFLFVLSQYFGSYPKLASYSSRLDAQEYKVRQPHLPSRQYPQNQTLHFPKRKLESWVCEGTENHTYLRTRTCKQPQRWRHTGTKPERLQICSRSPIIPLSQPQARCSGYGSYGLTQRLKEKAAF